MNWSFKRRDFKVARELCFGVGWGGVGIED